MNVTHRKLLDFKEVLSIRKYKVYKSKDINNPFCYVDKDHKLIKEPLYSIVIERGNESLGNNYEFNLRESEYNIPDLKTKCREMIKNHESIRSSNIRREWEYRKRINGIEPVNYQFKNITLTVITKPCYYHGGNLTDKGTPYTDKKVVDLYINGKHFYNNTRVLDIDQEIINDFLLDVIFFHTDIKENWTPIDITNFKTIKTNTYAPIRINTIGVIWKLPTESEEILFTNCYNYSYTLGEAKFEGYNQNNEHKYINVKLKDLIPENIVGELRKDNLAMQLLVMRNKYQMI